MKYPKCQPCKEGRKFSTKDIEFLEKRTKKEFEKKLLFLANKIIEEQMKREKAEQKAKEKAEQYTSIW